MQRSAVCDFLHGPLTSLSAVHVVRQALMAGIERHFEILYYRKDGKTFLIHHSYYYYLKPLSPAEIMNMTAGVDT